MVNWEDVEGAVVDYCDSLTQLTEWNKNIGIISSWALIGISPPTSDRQIKIFDRNCLEKILRQHDLNTTS
jgi:hypothetical protein